jgi:acetyltransferase-like isoleucine patch superfamily enzyme
MAKYETNKSIVYLILEWVWVLFALIIYGASLIVPVIIFTAIFHSLGLVISVLFLPAGVYIFLGFLILFTGLLHKLISPVKEGVYPLGRCKEVTNWLIHAGILNFISVPGFQNLIRSNPLLRRFYHLLNGAKIHPSALISYDACIVDPFLIEIGEGTKIGRWAKLAGHYSDENSFIFKKIIIGKNVLIGADCMIGPGVNIGDYSVVYAKSNVFPNTVIPSGEVWSGSPARFRKRISDEKQTP